MRDATAVVTVCASCAVFLFVRSAAHAEQSGLPENQSRSHAGEVTQPDKTRAPEPSTEDRFWSNLKGIPIGPLQLDLGAGLRFRGEAQSNYDIKKYGEEQNDGIFLERLRVEVGLHFMDGFRLFLQGQDAHELGCDFSNDDFPDGSTTTCSSSPTSAMPGTTPTENRSATTLTDRLAPLWGKKSISWLWSMQVDMGNFRSDMASSFPAHLFETQDREMPPTGVSCKQATLSRLSERSRGAC